MKKRLSFILCIAMILSLFNGMVSAATIDEPAPGTVIATKRLLSNVPDENGNLTIELSVQGSSITETTGGNADVVLVVDNSLSMDDEVNEPCGTPKDQFKLTYYYRLLFVRVAVYECPVCGKRYAIEECPDVCISQKVQRIDTAKKVGESFANTILSVKGNKLAVIGFSHYNNNGGANDTAACHVNTALTDDLNTVKTAINSMNAKGGTNYSAALQEAYNKLNERKDTDRPAYIIFISDGAPGLIGKSQGDENWNGAEQAASIKNAGIELYTIGIALSESEGAYLKSLASDDVHYINVTGENYDKQLDEIMDKWAQEIIQKLAGSNAVMTDVVNTEYFEIVGADTTLDINEDGKTVTWDIGNITDDKQTTLIKIKPINGKSGKDIHTNENVTLVYDDANGVQQTIFKEVIGDPFVTSYSVTYKNGEDILQGPTTVFTGMDIPDYEGKTPTKPNQKGISYTFNDWVLEKGCVEGPGKTVGETDLVYLATFDETEINYTVTWKNYDGTELDSATGLNFGNAIPEYTGVAPTKPSANGINYTFDKWVLTEGTVGEDGKIGTSNLVYTATYKSDAINYTVTWKNYDGTELDSATGLNFGNAIPEYTGVAPTKPSANGISYTFDKWVLTEGTVGEDGKIGTSNLVYTAQYDSAQINYTVTWKNYDGTVLHSEIFEHGTSAAAVEAREPAVPTRSGFDFVGFAPDYEEVLDNQIYVAQFTENEGGIIIIPTFELTLTKVDADDPETKLSGARFDLYHVTKSGERKIGNYTTDKDGVIKATVYSGGDYYWVETQSPAGYTLDTTPHYTSDSKKLCNIIVANEKTPTPPELNGTDHYAYIIGYEDGTARPEENVTRAQVATIFFRMLNEDIRRENLATENSFSDVDENAWYNTAVSTMAALGIMNGYPDGTFRPEAHITRAEFAKVAAGFDNSSVRPDADFSDIDAHWAAIDISIAAANGWVNGYADGTFKPDKKITRAETMALVNRVLNRNPQSIDDLLPDMVKWIDNSDETAWYYLDIQEASNSHDYERRLNHSEFWTDLRENPDWTAYEN